MTKCTLCFDKKNSAPEVDLRAIFLVKTMRYNLGRIISGFCRSSALTLSKLLNNLFFDKKNCTPKDNLRAGSETQA
jgi:hypothetical protein